MRTSLYRPRADQHVIATARQRRRMAVSILAAVLAMPQFRDLNIDLQAGLAQLPPNAAFRVANEARPPSSYLFNQFLPEVNRFDFVAKAGTMTVRTTMAGLVGMDSPYPETGLIEVSTFSENTAKIANRVRLSEELLRVLYAFLTDVIRRNGNVFEAIMTEALNFVDKMIVQAHLDTFEYLRGRALMGSIDWTFNKKRLLVDYGIPSGNIIAQATGNNAYGGSTSLFWTHVQTLRKLLKYNVAAFVIHPDLADTIRNNPANSLAVIAEDYGRFLRVRKINNVGAFTADVADVAEFIVYGEEGEILDPANPGKTIKVPFMPKNTILALGRDTGTRYIVGAGGTQPAELPLGYTHIAPTIEGRGAAGRWAEVYTPQGEPWAIEGRGVTNGLPVVESPDKIAIATTA